MQVGDFGTFFRTAKVGQWSLLGVSITPLAQTMSKDEAKITPIKDSQESDSVILVGVVITLSRFTSDKKETNTVLSGHSLSKLKMRSLKTTLGLLSVRAWMKLGFETVFDKGCWAVRWPVSYTNRN